MELIEWIIADENIDKAIKAVKANKGAPGIDKMTVSELDEYFLEHREEIKAQIRNKEYKTKPVRRVYIPKANGKQRTISSRPNSTANGGTGAVIGIREVLQ